MTTATLPEASPTTQELQEVSFDEAVAKVKEYFVKEMPEDFEKTASFRRVLRSLGFRLRPQRWSV